MKKLLLIWLISFTAFAGQPDVKRYTTAEGNWIAYRFVADGSVHCWSNYEYIDSNYFSSSWLGVVNTAAAYSWPVPTDPDVIAACDTTGIPRTIDNASWGFSYLYTVSIVGGVFTIGAPIEIPANTPCGDRVSGAAYGFAMHSVTHGAVTGMAVCR